MAKAKKLRSFVTNMYELEGHYFKVWQASDSGWWIEEVTEAGQKATEWTLWAETLKGAEATMTKEVAK
jgi:hypothetical protein